VSSDLVVGSLAARLYLSKYMYLDRRVSGVWIPARDLESYTYINKWMSASRRKTLWIPV
jgi:hypothetical protein